MSYAINVGLFGGLGTLITGFSLEGLLSHTHKVQTLVEAHLAKASSLDAGTVNDAYKFANNCLGTALDPKVSLVVGSICLGLALNYLAKSYERKE